MKSMTFVDKAIQNFRIKKAGKFIPSGAHVLDVGCSQGQLFKALSAHRLTGFGVDPLVTHEIKTKRVKLVRGKFPEDVLGWGKFDVITLLAVLEHIPKAQLQNFAKNCLAFLKTKGRVVITVPDKKVDLIIELLQFLKLVHADTLDEHHGYDPLMTCELFEGQNAKLIHKSTFQFGLNNLFVFQKI